LKKPHKGDIQEFTPMAIMSYIKQAGEAFSRIQKQRDGLKEIEIDLRAQAHLIGRMFIEDDIITSSQMNIIKSQIEHPQFDYGCKGSMWELYNHTTFALKEAHPTNWMKAHIDAHNFFLQANNIVSVPTEIVVQPLNQLELFNQ
jgi:hypothetical protein